MNEMGLFCRREEIPSSRSRAYRRRCGMHAAGGVASYGVLYESFASTCPAGGESGCQAEIEV